MDSILRLFIFTLFVTVAFSLGRDLGINLIPEIQNGTISSYPYATQLNSAPLYFTGYPGLAHINISTALSVAVCVSPYAAVTSNLLTQCPNPVNFYYTSLNPEAEFLLFLDDFSMNFMGKDGRSSGLKSDTAELSIPPYSPQHASVRLLQNVPYYVTIGLIDPNDINANSTEREIVDFSLEAYFPKCPNTSAPNSDVEIREAKSACIPLQSQLTPNTTSASLNVSRANPVVFSFDIDQLSLSAQIDFHIQSFDYNMTIFVGFGFVPSETVFNYTFTNASLSLNDSDPTSEFLGDLIQSFSIVIPNPKIGTYYAVIKSDLIGVTPFDLEFNTTECDLSSGTNQCGASSFQLVDSGNSTVQTITLSTTEVQYLVVQGTSVSFGLATNNTASPAFYQLDINSIPNMDLTSQIQPFKQAIGSAVGISLNSSISNLYVFAMLNGANLNTEDTVDALLWTGTTCPADCSNNGECNPSTFQCTCNDGFTGAYCNNGAPSPPGSPPSGGKKKFKTLYIILIIIGGAILLAILIGVPVALFLNNRKKARYERV